MVTVHPEGLAADGVHAAAAGYDARSRGVAELVLDCVPATRAGER
jgi:hypothetical protein